MRPVLRRLKSDNAPNFLINIIATFYQTSSIMSQILIILFWVECPLIIFKLNHNTSLITYYRYCLIYRYEWTGRDSVGLRHKGASPMKPTCYKRQKFTSFTIFFCSSVGLSTNYIIRPQTQDKFFDFFFHQCSLSFFLLILNITQK